jgi:hypothetical protein
MANKKQGYWQTATKEERKQIDAAKRRAVRQRIREVKRSSKCVKCGESNYVCLEFHHKDPSEKEITMTQAEHCRSMKKLEEELAKCEILCCNCHRKLHQKLGINSRHRPVNQHKEDNYDNNID